jgi:SAM-dependent methyltransferase
MYWIRHHWVMVSPSPLDPAVERYYEHGLEQDRLAPDGRRSVELIRTLELLERFLPPPPARVLDVGGGAGIYAALLRDRGYDVVLVDPVPLHVAQARAAGLTAVQGDARGLSVGTNTCDAVLLLGPLYHLPKRSHRIIALTEARRVAGGGPVVAAAISRFASTVDGLRHRFLLDPAFEAIVAADLTTGVHTNPTGRREWFTTAYFHRPDELAGELTDAGLTIDAVLPIEGPAPLLPEADEWTNDPARRELLLRAIRRVEHEPSLLGLSPHLLAVGHG